MTLHVSDKAAEHVKNACHYLELDESDVMDDLIFNYFDELLKDYGLQKSEKSDDIQPEWSENYLNSLGMSLDDF